MPSTDIDFDRPRSARRAAPPLPRARIAGASCVVCGLGRAEVLICRECAEQPEVSRARVLNWIIANDAQRDAVFDVWDQFCRANLGAWEKIRAAEKQPDYAARCKAHRDAGNVYGKLLDAHDAYLAAVQPLAIERARLEKAESALEGL